MLDRVHVENFLRLNGIDSTEPDEVIRSALIGARWHQNDVEIALMVLRENVDDHSKEVTTLHKVFRSDEKLSPNTISSLLGVDLTLQREGFQTYRFNNDSVAKSVCSGALKVFVVVSIAFMLAVFFAHHFSIGPFYSPV